MKFCYNYVIFKSVKFNQILHVHKNGFLRLNQNLMMPSGSGCVAIAVHKLYYVSDELVTAYS